MRSRIALAAALLAAGLVPVGAAETSPPGADRFVMGGSVRQSEPVEGDLFGMGGDFDLEAPVRGDAVLGGGDVRVRGPIAQDLYAGGGNVRLEAPVARNARLAGGDVEVAASATVGGNLTIAAGNAEVRGAVQGHVQVASGDVFIDAPVGGNVNVAAGELRLGPNARIGGHVTHRGPANVQLDPGAQVTGEIKRSSSRARGPGSVRAREAGSIGGWLWSVGLIALAGFIAGVFPAGSRRMGETLRGDPGIGFLVGFIALVCVPIAAVVLAITIIGIPLALAVLLLYFLMLIVGYAAVGVIVGDVALQRLRSQDAARAGWRVLAAMGAMLALVLLTRIPILGALVMFAALLAGLGALVLSIRARTRAPAAA